MSLCAASQTGRLNLIVPGRTGTSPSRRAMPFWQMPMPKPARIAIKLRDIAVRTQREANVLEPCHALSHGAPGSPVSRRSKPMRVCSLRAPRERGDAGAPADIARLRMQAQGSTAADAAHDEAPRAVARTIRTAMSASRRNRFWTVLESTMLANLEFRVRLAQRGRRIGAAAPLLGRLSLAVMRTAPGDGTPLSGRSPQHGRRSRRRHSLGIRASSSSAASVALEPPRRSYEELESPTPPPRGPRCAWRWSAA